MKNSLAIVILNWNGKELLKTFLPSVTAYSQQATLYVADNASSDGSVAYLKQEYPQVKIIQNSGNFGFAKGYNEALKQVDEDIFCLLNSDVEVTKNWLPPVMHIFEKDAQTAIIQPKLLDYNQRDHFEYAGAAGGFLDRYGYPYCRGRIFNMVEKDLGQYDKQATIFWASGACMFIRKKVFDTLAGFDEAFFAHMEEIDLCWRSQNAGYKVVFTPESKVYHVGGATLDKSNPRKTFLNFRNSLFTVVKNTTGSIFSLIATRLVLDGIAGIMFLVQFKPLDCLAIVKAHFNLYSNFPRLLKQRKQLPRQVKHYHVRSVVWKYFLMGKKTFDSL